MSGLSTRAFLGELKAERERLGREIAARRLALDPDPAARLARRRRLLVDQDYWWWATTYFPHYVRGAGSTFQRHFAQRVPQLLRGNAGCVEWWIAPRGEAKTSLATKLLPIWCALDLLLQRPEIRAEVGWTDPPPPPIDYILLLSAETRLPTKALDAIKTELLQNPSLGLDWPEVCGRGRIWRVTEVLTASGLKIEPFGAEQAVRGSAHGAARPKLLIPDDLITDAEAKSPTERENRWTWVTRAVEYLGPPDGSVKVVGVGTILHRDDPISRAKVTPGHLVHHFRALEAEPVRKDLWGDCEELMRNEDRRAELAAADAGRKLPVAELPSYRFYLRHQKAMDEGARVSWPGVRSLYELIAKRVRAPRAYATEMQGDGLTDERVFSSWTWWSSEPEPGWIALGAVDMSIGGPRNHPSGILWGYWSPSRRALHVREDSVKRRAPSKLRSDLVAGQRRHRAQHIAWENNQAQEDSRRTSIQYGLDQGCPLPLVGVTAIEDRVVRIESLEPYLTDPVAPSILIHPACAALVSELETWPEPQPHHDYEALCCLYMLWGLASSRAAAYALHRTPNPATDGLFGPGAF
ncbi:hypothetical protein [uncultured Lamprocystis sp.]|jgi:hypothetical protein|uniref:hypothetical protein n=1 Tax=uncultured Lamprocystis sp. TaxID=543132 RepID=UPI0025D3A4B1|nr:hypothetical protein [uncultured Lamprocystis sp.]